MQKKGFISRKGQVVQVVSFVTEIQSVQTLPLNTDTMIGLGAGTMKISITPKFDNSYFEISARWVGRSATDYRRLVFNISRDGTRVNINAGNLSSTSRPTRTSVTNYSTDVCNITALDKSGSTKGVVINYAMVVSSVINSVFLHTNKSSSSNSYIGSSEIIIKEIAQ